MHGSRRSSMASAQASHHAPADAVILNALPPEIREEAPPEDEMQATRFLAIGIAVSSLSLQEAHDPAVFGYCCSRRQQGHVVLARTKKLLSLLQKRGVQRKRTRFGPTFLCLEQCSAAARSERRLKVPDSNNHQGELPLGHTQHLSEVPAREGRNSGRQWEHVGATDFVAPL